MSDLRVLDACCGPRMFWFDSRDDRAVYVDIRQESHPIDIGTPETIGRSDIIIAPDLRASFCDLPFKSAVFDHVVFDPPHIRQNSSLGIFTRKYGFLSAGWRDTLKQGFGECWRVLRPGGTLIFKWSELSIKLSELKDLFPAMPLYGHRTGRRAKTIWIAFLKGEA